MMQSKATLLRTGMRLLLRDQPKRFLTKAFGEGWRVPLLRFSRFGPLISSLRGDTVVLGGCYQLDTIRQFLEVVGPHGRIVAIEANGEIVERLERDIAADPQLRHATNITLVAKGIWDKKGTATFIANADDYPALDKIASDKVREFSYSKVETTRQIEIEVDSLDNILSDVGVKKVDYVALTINDAELLALDGVDQLIRDNPNVRFFMNSHCPYPCSEVKQKLIDKGYKVFASPIPDSGLDKIYAFRQTGAARAHARPASKAERFGAAGQQSG